jgi:hypothetical protein
MQLIAHYDADGTIHALVRVDAPEGFSVMLRRSRVSLPVRWTSRSLKRAMGAPKRSKCCSGVIRGDASAAPHARPPRRLETGTG